MGPNCTWRKNNKLFRTRRNRVEETAVLCVGRVRGTKGNKDSHMQLLKTIAQGRKRAAEDNSRANPGDQNVFFNSGKPRFHVKSLRDAAVRMLNFV